MFIFFIILLAIGLSMDTFSLSLSYGMFDIEKKQINRISIIVGLFHFIMPLLGNIIGKSIMNLININNDRVMGIIFLLISIEMIITYFKEDKIILLNNFQELIVLPFIVSIDSFIAGIGLNTLNTPYLVISTIFMLTSSFFTYIGLNFGKKLNEKLGKKSELLGIIIIISLSIKYIFI